MARRRYLVMYDISDDKRLRRVHTVACAYGRALQFSVFVCDINRSEMVNLKWELGGIIDHKADSVAFVDLGDTERVGDGAFSFLGRPVPLPRGGPAIV